MIRRNVIGFASAVALLAATACDSGDSNGTGEYDAAVRNDGGSADSGGAVRDGSVEAGADAGTDGGSRDGGNMDASDLDAARDASSPGDAQTQDARADASEVELDAGTAEAAVEEAAVAAEAAIEEAGAVDAAPEADAAQADAASDASVSDSGTITLPALAARYTFDENTGTVAADSVGEFADATLVNGAGWTTGRLGNALDLAGGATNQYATLPASILDGCDDITIALWMKLGSETPWSRLLDIDGVVDGFLYFTPTQPVNGASHLLFNIFHPPGEGADDQRVSAPYPTGTVLVDVWHHVAFTLSAGTGRLYFDGVEIGSNAMTTKPSDLSLGATARAWMGRSTFADPYLDASIDDLRVSCTAYTAEQVAALVE